MTDYLFTHSRARDPAFSPVLTVLIPFYKDDCTPLIEALTKQSKALSKTLSKAQVEILVYDDGTNDDALTAHVQASVKSAAPAHISLITALKNQGRSEARNYLQSSAHSEWVLFLDADMLPQTPDFLSLYLDLIQSDCADIIFGGFTVLKQSDTPEHELHRVLSEVSDCHTAQHRQISGPQHVATSNLCVRKSVLDSERFDPEFTGWGWEDSEWAARVSNKYRLVHADIPAIHLGLETTDTLLKRFRDSAQNYVLFTNKHPDLAKRLTLYTTAYKIKRIPGQALMRPVLKRLVKVRIVPVKIRLIALKLWRASWYAEALP